MSERWGIIYCPKQGVVRTHRRWEQIQQCLQGRGVEYDFVQSEDRGSVERLTRMLVQNGYTTLVIVGGDSALNQAVNGMLSVDPDLRHRVTLGVIPNGYGNDFARYWGIGDDIEHAVDVLINRRVRTVDVGYVCLTGEPDVTPDAPSRYFLNCVNIGLVAHIQNLKHRAYRFWGMSSLSYASSFLLLLFHRMETRMQFRINYEQIERSVMTMCIGNCRGYGQTPNAVPYNGMLDVSVVSQPEVLKLISGMWMLISGRFLNNKSVTPHRTRSVIRVQDIGNARVSIDGKVWDAGRAPMEIGVRQEWIRFIIPS